jgi:hypothetical protein
MEDGVRIEVSVFRSQVSAFTFLLPDTFLIAA